MLSDQGEIKLDNQAYIDKLVTEAGMADCNTNKSPISKEMLKRAAEEQHDDILLADDEKTQFQSHAGDFQWLAQTTHPCIATATSILSTFCAPTSEQHGLASQAFPSILQLRSHLHTQPRAHTHPDSLIADESCLIYLGDASDEARLCIVVR